MLKENITITEEISLRDFPFWGNAEMVSSYLTEDEFEMIEDFLNESYPGGIDKTDLNDFFAFDEDTIAQWLGYDDFDALREDRDNK